MRRQSFLRALVLAAVLTAPVVQTAMADGSSEQQAMHQASGSDANAAYSNGVGPYDNLAPTQGN